MLANRVRIGSGSSKVKYVMLDENGKIATSSDGINWTVKTIAGFKTYYAASIAYGNGIWAAIGESPTNLLTSSDGINWTVKPLPTEFQDVGCYDIAFGTDYQSGANLWMIACAHGVLYSYDLLNWVYNTTIATDKSPRCIAYGKIGYNGVISNAWAVGCTDAVIITNEYAPGGTWAIRQTDLKNNTPVPTIACIAYGNGVWVAGASSGKITIFETSLNFYDFRLKGDLSATCTSVAFGNGIWVITGFSGKLATSTDGTNWTVRTSGFGTDNINSVTYGDGLWITVGDAGKIATSSDGTNWTVRTIAGLGRIRRVAYGGD